MNDSFEISARHNSLLHQACGLADHEPLPKGLEVKYQELHRIYCRQGVALPEMMLGYLVYHHGCGKATAKETAPPTIVDLWKKKKVKRDDPVIAKYRGKEVEARIVGINPRTGGVELEFADGKEVEVPKEDVRVPELVEV